MKTINIKNFKQIKKFKINDVETVKLKAKNIKNNCGQCNISLYLNSDGTYSAGFVEPMAIGANCDLVIFYS